MLSCNEFSFTIISATTVIYTVTVSVLCLRNASDVVAIAVAVVAAALAVAAGTSEKIFQPLPRRHSFTPQTARMT